MTAMATGFSRPSRPFPGYEGNVSVAMGDVDGDGVYDLLVGAGKDHAPEVVVYSGKARDGKNAFGTELARFQPFAAEARGGVSVTAAQIDGTSADNIIVGSGPAFRARSGFTARSCLRLAPRRPCSRPSVPMAVIGRA